MSDELAHARGELAEAEKRARRALEDYESGAIATKQWSRLDARYQQKADHARAACERLTAKLREVQGSIPVEAVDRALDRVNSLRRIIGGGLMAEDTPALRARLLEVFERFTVERAGGRVTIEPKLRPEWLPDGMWIPIAAGQPSEGVGVVDYWLADRKERMQCFDLGVTCPCSSGPGAACGSAPRGRAGRA